MVRGPGLGGSQGCGERGGRGRWQARQRLALGRGRAGLCRPPPERDACPVPAPSPVTGLRIQRMPAEEGAKFGDPLAYPYMTVAAPSSHDTSVTRGWWESHAAQRQEFYAEVSLGGGCAGSGARGRQAGRERAGAARRCCTAAHTPPALASSPLQVLGGEGTAPETCTAGVLEHILQQHMDAPSMLAIFPLQDLLPLTARLPDCPPAQQQINEPSNPQHYWRYRLHVTLEQVAQDEDLRALLTDMLQAAQRYHGSAPSAAR